MMTSAFALMAASAAVTAPAYADEAAAKKWIDSEFQPSTLSKDDQMKEMQWFIKAAEPFKGMEINVVSETLTTHEYESRTLAKAFEEITGIKVKHDIIQEGDVVEKIQTQMQSGKNVYDGWINDSDFIGTHFRYGQAVDLTDWMAGEAKDVTDPMLDVNDFIGKSFTTAPNGHLYQLPDQQFANLYWFRYDWFTNPDIKAKFKAKYGYDLGVPVNWSAYEDIADFFTNDVKEINGVKVYGHMDYGKKDPSLGWRFTDAWLSMAGNGDKGLPNGLPVDEWGIRMEGCRPVGSSVERGGDVNGPAAVYSIVKYLDWLVLNHQKIDVDYLRVKAFPFNSEVEAFLKSHATIFVVEQNRDAQLKSLLILETAVEKAKLFSILNYSGLPISAQPIVDEIRAKLAEAPRLSAVPR
jgi:glycerol transport system substrate-binding protein